MIVNRVPLVEPIKSYYMVILGNSISVTRVPLIEPINSYYLIIFPKLISVSRVPLVGSINTYYMVILSKLQSAAHYDKIFVRIQIFTKYSYEFRENYHIRQMRCKQPLIDLMAPNVAIGKKQ